MRQTIEGQLVDIHQRRTYPAEVLMEGGVLVSIKELEAAPTQYILPGFVDAHVHIESSMLAPAEFARLAVTHGTIASISDPHEIANVCGIPGVEWMLENAAQTPFKIFFGAPSCVPATQFETAGATLDATAVKALLARDDIWYLTELMNYPGVLQGDLEVKAKLEAARNAGKPVDGHAPGLRGEEAVRYAAAGISTDHECTTLEEALDKIAAGMHILIREGSAAKNFEALHPLLGLHPSCVMLCSDDKHPNDLARGHINELVLRALALGYDLYDVLRAASCNPVVHYRVPVGMLRTGDTADFIVVENLEKLHVLQTWIDGKPVYDAGCVHLPEARFAPINQFNCAEKTVMDFALPAANASLVIRAIQALDGQLLTQSFITKGTVAAGMLVSNAGADVLKIAVINRYSRDAKPAVAFIRGFGLKHGALAATVAHDCHNIVAVGADDESLCAAVNAVISAEGGMAVAASATEVTILPLPVAGLMSNENGQAAAAAYNNLDAAAKALGSPLSAPFMTLSFMALLVIPSLKLSDLGLFNGDTFAFVPVQIQQAES